MYKDFHTFVFRASAALTASAAGSSVFIPYQFSWLTVVIHVTAQSGTSPTLDTKFQVSNDNANWYDLVYREGTTGMAFAQYAAATGKKVLQVACFGGYMRVYNTITGTSPSFTFKVEGFAKKGH